MFNYPEHYRVIIVGAGHAGVEAALATSRRGISTLLLTLNLDTIAQMSCNPAIGGIAKGQIVREIDALGGEMARNTDITGIQFRILNQSKGPAVQSPRAQCDRKAYQLRIKHTLEQQENLEVRQAEVTTLVVNDKKVCGVITRTGTYYAGDCLILTTGTFLRGLIHLGLESYPGGRGGELPAEQISLSLEKLGFQLGRLKTGTPPRINKRGIDFSHLQSQPGDEFPQPFSHFTSQFNPVQLPCWLASTTPETHQIIADNLDRSPLYTGRIKAIGPRYCPSIEDKIVRFPQRERHQVFLEPEGRETEEFYCNGIATSLPEDVQVAFVRSIPGLAQAQITRFGYAIEYDFCPPTQLKPSLESKEISHLFFAGQINGTTGYEEAAAQGLLAGINAGQKILGEEPLILRRDEAYIGVLIDDLVTRGVDEPYRMFTARAEFRLFLRSDNADNRLLNYGYSLGLIPQTVYQDFLGYRQSVEKVKDCLRKTIPEGAEFNLARQITQGKPVEIAFPIEDYGFWKRDKIIQSATIEIKYAGYLAKQEREANRLKRLESRRIPDEFNYSLVKGLLTESHQKLERTRPQTLAQAMRVPGVTPVDIQLIMLYLERPPRAEDAASLKPQTTRCRSQQSTDRSP